MLSTFPKNKTITIWKCLFHCNSHSLKISHLIPCALLGSYFIYCLHLFKVVLCPLYVVRSHLPCPVFINIDTSKLNIHQQKKAPGQGSDLQLQCAGGDIHHTVTFQFRYDNLIPCYSCPSVEQLSQLSLWKLP